MMEDLKIESKNDISNTKIVKFSCSLTISISFEIELRNTFYYFYLNLAYLCFSSCKKKYKFDKKAQV